MKVLEVEQIEYKHGKLNIVAGDQIKTAIEDRSQDRSYQNYIVRFLHKYGRKGSNVIDVGANIGVFTIPMSKFVGEEGHVYSFEPVKFTHSLLRKNVKLNELDNVTCYRKGLSDKSETVTIYNSTINMGHSCIISETRKLKVIPRKTTINEEIECMRLDDFHLDNVSFIKIDVEGYEDKVLLGALETIRRNKPAIIIEVPMRNKNEVIKCQRCNGLLEGIDYLAAIRFGSKDCLYLPRELVIELDPKLLKAREIHRIISEYE